MVESIHQQLKSIDLIKKTVARGFRPLGARRPGKENKKIDINKCDTYSIEQSRRERGEGEIEEEEERKKKNKTEQKEWKEEEEEEKEEEEEDRMEREREKQSCRARS